uniref:ribonuclease H n=1 Tax=Scleropages formosus TaxID=113540 RepID=A0A8C9TLE4_SCLFO
LEVDGRKIKFLVDTGATRSTLRSKEAQGAPTSGQFANVVGAAGLTHFLAETLPLPVSSPKTSHVVHHAFLLSDFCPVNLLGRDLLAKLDVRIQVIKDSTHLSSPSLGLLLGDCVAREASQFTKYFPEWLSQIDPRLWASGKNDFGRMVTAKPLVVVPKSDYHPHRHQYPLSPEAEEDISKVHAELVQQGTVKEIAYSPINSPILPVRKANGSWHFVQDLRWVNSAVQTWSNPLRHRAPTVRNPFTIISLIPAEAEWFSVIDLANAFFSIPVHPDSQYWFAFTFKGKQWTIMPQGYTESSSVYAQEVGRNLEQFDPKGGSVLIQYVDDLLLCSKTREACETDTRALLSFLAENGHKASKAKLQLVKQKMHYLGHDLSKEAGASQPELQVTMGHTL